MSPDKVVTEVDGRELTVSNLAKVLYPDTGFTKGQVLDYYARIAEVMLPHLRDRPVTLKRFPHGVSEAFFYEKHAPARLPEWIRTIDVPSKSGDHEPITYIAIDNRASLVWAANLAALEFHVPMWRAAADEVAPTAPDHMVFDLDPGPGTDISDCCRVARWIAEAVGEDGVQLKTSGSKGLQLYRPIKNRTSDESSAEAHELARQLERDYPDNVVSNMKKDLRSGKVLIDWSQNNAAKTTVAAYSLRGRPEPTVSTPVTWDEVDSCAASGRPDDLRFDADQVLARVEKLGDLMAEPRRRPRARARATK